MEIGWSIVKHCDWQTEWWMVDGGRKTVKIGQQKKLEDIQNFKKNVSRHKTVGWSMYNGEWSMDHGGRRREEGVGRKEDRGWRLGDAEEKYGRQNEARPRSVSHHLKSRLKFCEAAFNIRNATSLVLSTSQ